MGSLNMEKREELLKPEQVKIAMNVNLIEGIIKNLNRYLHDNKAKKVTLVELKSVSMKSCYAVKQMAAKFEDNFFTEDEKKEFQKIEDEISYEIVLGKVEKKFRWQYTKELVDYLKVLADKILNRNGISRANFYL